MGRKGHGRYGKHSRRDRRKKKGGIISTVILIVAICVFAFSAFQLYKIFNGYHKGESEYNDLVKLAVTEDKGEQENGTDDQDGSRFSVDFDALRQINPDVVAWIRFDEPAVINYPVVQGSDNSEYLSKTFKGYDNTVGTIFVNAYNHADFNDRNTIIYGHYMYNGTMFNELEQYHEKSFWEKYPSFYIYTPDGNVATYQIYSVGVVKDTSEGYTYQFADDAAFASFLEATKASSLYDTGVEVGYDSQIVTLSTCTREGNDDRTIVHGVRVNVQPAGE